MKIYAVNYWETKGIIELDATVGEYGFASVNDKRFGRSCLCWNEWCHTRKGAKVFCHAARRKRIEQLRKRIAKLEAMEF